MQPIIPLVITNRDGLRMVQHDGDEEDEENMWNFKWKSKYCKQ